MPPPSVYHRVGRCRPEILLLLSGEVACLERLGGLLKHDSRQAA
ncbi:MAG: hypothetical protein JWO38_1519 [Gemmataceae bacterium]|nr:hypothetical protein [Gemmataceae bacterium]